MKNSLLFDFVANQENNTITIKKEFAANRQLVWDCHTKSELLDQWFAPVPFTVKTNAMDFRNGGYWWYAMIDPNGTEYHGRMDYLKINPISDYSLLDAFCNDKGEINHELPRAQWNVTLHDQNDTTLVETIVTYKSLAELETVVNMGMKEGLTSTLERLDTLLATINRKS